VNVIILSGGSGRRLWPLSNDTRAKQFLKVFRGENGQPESMLQHMWRMLDDAGLSDNALIATNSSQADLIRNHLGADVPIIVEPERRDTFPAIALAAVHLYSAKKAGLSDIVAVIPVDPVVKTGFFHAVKNLGRIVASSDKIDIGLLGAKPDHPSVSYGYILPDTSVSYGEQALKIERFVEKPSEEEAWALIERQALWNCGVFVFKLGFLIRYLESRHYPVQYKMLLKNYSRLPKISFDYEVVEKAANLAVLPYDGEWKDIGTWKTLTEVMSTNIIGNGLMSGDCKNSHIVNELDIPVAVMGLSNVIVAASPDGILVSDKNASCKLKDVIPPVQKPAFEEKRWGWTRTLDVSKSGDRLETLVRRVFVQSGKNISYHVHRLRTETWHILSGEGLLVLDGKISRLRTGDTVTIPPHVMHAVKAMTDLELLEVQKGSGLLGEDIERIRLNWPDIEKLCVPAYELGG